MLKEFDFHLPEILIAQYPLERGGAKMLYRSANGEILDTSFSKIVHFFREGDLIVMNNTKVIPARLNGTIDGIPIRINLIKKIHDEWEKWEILGKPRKKILIDTTIDFNHGLSAVVVEKNNANGMDVIQFNVNSETFNNKLAEIGSMPLPPYIKRSADIVDEFAYQTVYASMPGSVAAPTAGLHFSEEILYRLKQKGVQTVYVTLHIGGGTFLPVRTENISDHKMHSEHYVIDANACSMINSAKTEGRRIIAVGTTSARTLESAAKLCHDGSDRIVLKPHMAETRLFITPGYTFKVIDGLVTNFHLPKSTLFMLVCAFLGSVKNGQDVYRHAIQHCYRFFSYGDACFFINA